jgi:Protein of unknown function (DUF4239)
MTDQILSRFFFNQWLVIGTVSALLLAATELGFHFGLRLHQTKDEARKGQIAGIQGAVLGLLALLLGFTFAMAVGRYEKRRELVLQEANAIGTTYLRASLLSETHRTDVEQLLRRYVDVRLDFYEAGSDETRQARAEKDATGIQRQLWQHAVDAGRESPSPLVASFISALNETIDLDATRLNASRAHVPGAVWLLVLAVAASGCCASGYGAGSSGVRSNFANIALPLLIAVVITLLVDLDRPHSGLIQISQQPMLDLKPGLMPHLEK